jgi:hypothetical protein
MPRWPGRKTLPCRPARPLAEHLEAVASCRTYRLRSEFPTARSLHRGFHQPVIAHRS